MGRYLHVRRSDAAPGFALTWHLDYAALAEDAEFDGVYRLLTNDTGPATRTTTWSSPRA